MCDRRVKSLQKPERGNPMEQYEVVMSDKADDDMEGIYKYISENLQEPVIAANHFHFVYKMGTS